LTKKELKAIEDAEFEALMGGVEAPKQDDKKKSEPAAEVGAGNSKNQKKKEKAK